MYNEQVLDVVNMGVVVLDNKYTVIKWNRWLEIHSHKSKEEIEGALLFTHYPQLSTPSFLRSCKSVLNFGNFVFYSQKLHNYLFPFTPTGFQKENFEFMQQSCTLAPLRDEQENLKYIVITINNVTESVHLEQSLKQLSQQDSLTGTFNRRYLDRRLDEEFTRYNRKGSLFCLLMIDLDDFKMVNDTYGHPFGDTVLKEMAVICKRIIRGSDILARYGGEEFCLVLPQTPLEGAMAFAERLRILIEEYDFILENKKPVNVSISIGVSQIQKNMTSVEQLIELADAGLYKSKDKGKNCVTCLDKIR